MTQVQGPSVPASSKKRKLYIATAVIVVLLIIVAGIIISTLGNNGHPSSTPSPTSTTLVQSGTVWQLSASQYEYVPFTLSAGATMTGTFKVTGGSATFYIFTPSEYADFAANGTASSYLYTTAPVTVGSVNTSLQPGTYYLVFASDNSFLAESVSVTTSFLATSN